MPKQSAHKSLDVYNLSRQLVVACYELTHELPPEEKTNFIRYIRTAALSLHVNVAQGVFLKSKKKRKYVRAAQNALIVIDAATEILVEVKMVTQEQVDVLTSLSSNCYQLLDEL
jgi:four helix bundle protein